MQLTFHGAAGQVTGSMFQLSIGNDYNVLIDCGLNYEHNFNREENAIFPFDPKSIDLVILTHAHLDHSGNLPTLFAKGYQGNVICTEPTLDLIELLLKDSASLEAARIKKHHKTKTKKQNAFRLYGHGDVLTVMNNTVTMPYFKPVEINESVTITFVPAGHILGAASIILDVREDKVLKRFLFTGDLGGNDSLITLDPHLVEDVDYLIMESTYGSRQHQDTARSEDVLEQHIQKTCIDKRGRLVIPAFSVGRTQSILYALNRLFKSQKIKPFTVFADSPMGMTSSEIHHQYASYLNPEVGNFLNKYHDLFRFKELYIIEDQADVDYMETYADPYIIVSSAGMLEGGRIQKHVKFNIANHRSTILMAGYCVPGTLGHQLLMGSPELRIQGKSHPVFADVAVTDAFSAHPDQAGLIQYFNAIERKGNLKNTFLVHGDESNLQALYSNLKPKTGSLTIPVKGETFTI